MRPSFATLGSHVTGDGEFLPHLKQDLLDVSMFVGMRLTDKNLRELKERFDTLIPRIHDPGVFVSISDQQDLHNTLSLLLGHFEQQCRTSRKMKL